MAERLSHEKSTRCPDKLIWQVPCSSLGCSGEMNYTFGAMFLEPPIPSNTKICWEQTHPLCTLTVSIVFLDETALLWLNFLHWWQEKNNFDAWWLIFVTLNVNTSQNKLACLPKCAFDLWRNSWSQQQLETLSRCLNCFVIGLNANFQRATWNQESSISNIYCNVLLQHSLF